MIQTQAQANSISFPGAHYSHLIPCKPFDQQSLESEFRVGYLVILTRQKREDEQRKAQMRISQAEGEKALKIKSRAQGQTGQRYTEPLSRLLRDFSSGHRYLERVY